MIDESWSIEFYRDARGRDPVGDFIETLDAKMRAKVSKNLEHLALFGDRLSMPLVRPIRGYRFWELRVQSGGNIVRLFYFAASARRIILLHGFVKKTAQTPVQELRVAERRYEAMMGDDR